MSSLQFIAVMATCALTGAALAVAVCVDRNRPVQRRLREQLAETVRLRENSELNLRHVLEVHVALGSLVDDLSDAFRRDQKVDTAPREQVLKWAVSKLAKSAPEAGHDDSGLFD